MVVSDKTLFHPDRVYKNSEIDQLSNVMVMEDALTKTQIHFGWPLSMKTNNSYHRHNDNKLWNAITHKWSAGMTWNICIFQGNKLNYWLWKSVGSNLLLLLQVSCLSKKYPTADWRKWNRNIATRNGSGFKSSCVTCIPQSAAILWSAATTTET